MLAKRKGSRCPTFRYRSRPSWPHDQTCPPACDLYCRTSHNESAKGVLKDERSTSQSNDAIGRFGRYEIMEVLGVARGSTVRARNVGRDIMAGLKNIVGGEIEEYTKLQAYSREQALERMMADAQKMGADAVVGVRITTSMVATGAAEMLAYGTAVTLN